MMTTCRVWLLAALVVLAGAVAAQTAPAPLVPNGTSAVPTTWSWAYGEFQPDPASPADSPWRSSLPQLLVRGWGTLPRHSVTPEENAAWQQQHLQSGLRDLEKQISARLLERSRLLLQPVVPAGEPQNSDKALSDLHTALEKARGAPVASLDPTLPFKLVVGSGNEGLPSRASNPEALERETHAFYLVTGTFKLLSGYLSVQVALTSTLEHRVLATWNSTFAADEAPVQMSQARQALMQGMLGRPWASLALSSEVDGTTVDVGDGGRKTLPWQGEFLSPGIVDLVIHRPGRAAETRSIELQAQQTATILLKQPPEAAQLVELTSSPSGASVTLDSRLVGTTPLSLPSPLGLSRLTLQLAGYAPAVLEIGPQSPTTLNVELQLPKPAPATQALRDRFYTALLTMTLSATGATFLKEFSEQAYTLASSYSVATNRANFQQAVGEYQTLWYASQATVALTTGIFVWMMMTLSDYLGAAQTPLP